MPSLPKIRVVRNGLTELYVPSGDKAVQAHVIFVHGLFGSPDKTWTKDLSDHAALEDDGRPSHHAVFWPEELLPKIVPRATVHTWGYDADIDNFMQPASKNSVYQHARNLLNDLCDLRDTYEDKAIPFIFITHSLGGLIVKDALNRSSSELGTRIKTIAPNTFGVCFLGTPHRGSKLAKSGRHIVALTSLASRHPNVKLIQALEQNSETLDRIGDLFLQTVDKYGLQIASFGEEREIRLFLFINMFIVKPDSAKIGHSKEETGTIPADHRNMAKFDSESDTGFRRVSKIIKRWVEMTIPSRKDEYQDCLHSLKIPEAGARYQQVVENHDRTFGWLFEKNTVHFIDWLSETRDTGPAGRLFWITGKPGSGKSTIMKHAVRNPKTMYYLKSSTMRKWHMIPFFFSDRGSEQQRAFQTMLQEILYQLLDLTGDAFNLVLPFYTRLAKTHKTKIPKWDLDTLREGILEVIVKSTSETGICLFMDALDEHSGDNENLCNFFWDLSNKSEGSLLLKICLASRPWPVFQKHFRGCQGFAIHAHTEKDIWNYVTSRLYEIPGNIESQNTATEDQIQEETGRSELAQDVTRNAQGVFIWVRLVTDELFQGLTDGTPISMLRKTLKDIPHELEDLYARALSKVRPVYAAEAHIILHMVLSSLSPIRIQTLLDCASWLLVDGYEPQKPEDQNSRLASRTGGLLETVNSDGFSIVQFIHQTTKEYVRSQGRHLTLNYMDKPLQGGSEVTTMFGPSSPLQPITRDEFRCMEGPDFLLLCGTQLPLLSASTIPHLFAYAKQVDDKLPRLFKNRQRLALETLKSLLVNESVWKSTSAYTSLISFVAGRLSHIYLAIAANWKNMITLKYSFEGASAEAVYLAALGPSVLGNFTDRVGMVKAFIDGHQRPEKQPHLAQIERSDRRRMLESVGAVAYDIKGDSPLLETLVSIKSHPLVSESERVDIARLLLDTDEHFLAKYDVGFMVSLEPGCSIRFRSALSFCLHVGSVEWINMFLEKARRFYSGEQENLAHCLASHRDFANQALRASFPQRIFENVEEELRPIPTDEEGILGVGWPLVWLASQSGVFGFPRISQGFCSSGAHRRERNEDITQI